MRLDGSLGGSPHGGAGALDPPTRCGSRGSTTGAAATTACLYSVSASLRAVEDYTNKYKGEQVELALFGGEYQEGVLTAYCSIEDVPHVELNGHILVPLQNIASLHCSSRCDAPEPDWPPQGLADERDDRDDE